MRYRESYARVCVVPFANRYYVYSPELQLLSVSVDDNPNLWGKTAIAHAAPAMKREIAWFNGRPVLEAIDGITSRYTFTDHLGTPLLQADASAAIVWRAEYEPYGDIWSMRAGTPAEQILRFPGQEYVGKWEGVEERYNIARWYRSGWGRYTQADPIGLRGGINLFAYGKNDPIRMLDPLGLVVVNNNGTEIFHGTLDEVVSACHGLNVKGCVLGWNDRVRCNCECSGGYYHAKVSLTFGYRVWYATSTRIPGDVIRAAELQHVSDQEAFDAMVIADAEWLEKQRFRAKFMCADGCVTLKWNDKLRRAKYLLWDILKGHDESGAH